MVRCVPLWLLVLALQPWVDLCAEDAEPSADEIQRAVAKSLPLLERGAKGSMEQRKQCFTCHNQGLPILALTAARTRGFDIDADHLQAQLQFTADFLGKNKQRYLEGKGQGGQVDTAGYALWALAIGGWNADETTAAVAEYLLVYQADDDHWQSASRRPPSEQSPFTATYLALRALKQFGTPDQQPRIDARIEHVRQWLLGTPGEDTEDRVFRLRALQLVAAPSDQVRAATDELLQAQRADGGWSQLAEMDSDAYAAGSVLVALQQTGALATDDAAYRKGLRFLISSQLEDGSWHVVSRSKPFQTYFESGYPHGKDQFISIAAAGWATTALALALAEAPTTARIATTLNVELASDPDPFWKRHTIDNTSQGADGVKLGDINGDGRQDVVTGWEQGGEVRLYLNPGPTAAGEPWPRVTVGQVRDAEEAVFGDFDGDGMLDVVSCTEGKTRTVYWHRFSGSPGDLLDSQRWITEPFAATREAQAWMQAAPMDLDGQHGLDIVLAAKNSGATIGWLQSPASPRDAAAWQFWPLQPVGWVMSLLPCDLDEDGDLDLVYSDRKGADTGVFVLENPGPAANREHAAWTKHLVGARGRQAMFADLADVNRDGRLDVAVAVKPAEVILCLQQPDRGWRESTIRLDATHIGDAKAVKIADVNGDGRADLLFTCEDAAGDKQGVVWIEQCEAGTWRQHSLGGPDGRKYDLMQTLDLDDDGDLDVLTCEESDLLGVVWYENPSGGEGGR